jgi:hypothetical protein
MSTARKPLNYKQYCFMHKENVLFFHYNVGHPLMKVEFEVGKVIIFIKDKLYTRVITSKPYLNSFIDWN